MKRILFFLFLVVAVVATGCLKENPLDADGKIREMAWNSLTTEEKATVTVDWKNAPIKESRYLDRNAYQITFNTSQDALLGPIVVYVDYETLLVAGRDLRE